MATVFPYPVISALQGRWPCHLALVLACVAAGAIPSPVAATTPPPVAAGAGAGSAGDIAEDGLSTAEAPRAAIRLPSLAQETARFDPWRFVETRAALTASLFDLRDKLTSAIRPSPLEVDLLLDLAALHLSQRMLPEAGAFLQALPAQDGVLAGGPRLSPIQSQRARVLRAALDGLRGQVDSLPPGWADAPLYVLLAQGAQGDGVAVAAMLVQAVDIVAAYPAALADPILPRLLEVAIDNGSWDLARHLAGQLRQGGARDQATAYRYLLGQAALTGGDHLAAFDNLAAAAAGADEWAQRARLALIDLGQATGSLSVEDARQLLAQTRALWVGGPLGLATLQRLAALERQARRDLPALDVLAAIIREHPDTPAAEAAQTEARALIAEVYAKGLNRQIDLSTFVATHRALQRDFGHAGFFDRHAEDFGDDMAARGASMLAAATYESLQSRLASRAAATAGASDAAPAPVDPAPVTPTLADALPDPLMDRLRLKQAAALIAGGQMVAAEAVLQAPLASTDPELQDRRALLRAQVFAATDRPVEVLGTQMLAPGRDYLRLRAEAAFAIGDWFTAQTAYEQLLGSLGSALPRADRINLVLAAHRGGDPARLETLLARFGIADDEWAALAAGLSVQAPAVLPLRGQAARQRIADADTALRLLQAATEQTMP